MTFLALRDLTLLLLFDMIFDQKPDDQVDALVKEMLGLLMKYQERARIKDAVKAKARRRLVFGLREVSFYDVFPYRYWCDLVF